MAAKKSDAIIVTWRQCCDMFRVAHMWNKSDVNNLHDIWRRGIPTPDSIIRVPRLYDERLEQPGNIEKHIIAWEWISDWLVDVLNRRGIPASARYAKRLKRQIDKEMAKYEK